MKFLITLTILSFGITFESKAANSVITVVNDSGGETHFDPKKWKVVRRTSKTTTQCKPQIKWKTINARTKTTTKTVEKVVFKKNRISILAGYGPIGLITRQQNGERKVFFIEKEYGPVTGLRYTRNISPIWSFSAEYITNNTGVGTIGWGF